MSDALFKNSLGQMIETMEQKRAAIISKWANVDFNSLSTADKKQLSRAYDHYLLEKEQELKEKKASEELEQRIKLFKAKVPSRYKEASLDDFKEGKLKSHILSGESALLLGPNGVGKTHFAWALGRAWAEKNESFLIVKAALLLSEIKTIANANPFTAIYERYGKFKHLVIDEIDKIYGSTTDYLYINSLIDYRYEYELQTIVIGNGSVDDFVKVIGPSVYSRLSGDGSQVWDLSRAKDRRKQ